MALNGFFFLGVPRIPILEGVFGCWSPFWSLEFCCWVSPTFFPLVKDHHLYLNFNQISLKIGGSKTPPQNRDIHKFEISKFGDPTTKIERPKWTPNNKNQKILKTQNTPQKKKNPTSND